MILKFDFLTGSPSKRTQTVRERESTTNECPQRADHMNWMLPNFTLVSTNKIIAAFHAQFVIQFICSLWLIATLNALDSPLGSCQTHTNTQVWQTEHWSTSWDMDLGYMIPQTPQTTPNRSNTKHLKSKQFHMILLTTSHRCLKNNWGGFLYIKSIFGVNPIDF